MRSRYSILVSPIADIRHDRTLQTGRDETETSVLVIKDLARDRVSEVRAKLADPRNLFSDSGSRVNVVLSSEFHLLPAPTLLCQRNV